MKIRNGAHLLLFVLLTVWTKCSPAAAAAGTQPVATDTSSVGAVLDTSATPPSNQLLHLTFALKSTTVDSASAYVSSEYDPSSPNYHKWLTPAQYGDKFGASSSALAAVLKYVESHGFSNIKLWSNHLFISADSSVAHAQTLFRVNLVGCKRSTDEAAKGASPTYYAPDRKPTVDTTTGKALVGIFGLSNIAARRSFIQHQPLTAEISSPTPLNPADLSDIYDLSPLRTTGYLGHGATVAIFSPTTYKQSDVQKFLSTYDITGTTIKNIPVSGGTDDNSNADEACLDIESIAGQAPLSTIDVYEGPNDGSFDIFNAIAEADPDIVSDSYGIDENQVDSTYASQYEAIRMQMAAQGISIFAASGDNGAYDDVNQRTITTSVDATSAYVTAVGGTELTQNPSNISEWDGETAWTYNDGTLQPNTGSGGGLSVYITQPSWQAGPGVITAASDGRRQIPDISALGSTPYYNIYTDGAFESVGGTSASTAFMAGAMAVVDEAIGTRVGNLDPLLYQYGTSNQSVYHDITSGNNGAYFCTPRWDFVTGWGSPDLNLLAGALETSFTNAVSQAPAHLFGPGLQMFSVPYQYEQTTPISQILSGLVTTSGLTSNTIAAWLPLSSSYALSPTAPANLPVPGEGYWGRFSSTGGSLVLEGTPVTSDTFDVAIEPGWNIIGDPYVVSVPIDSLQIETSSGTVSFSKALANGEVSPNLYDYNGSAYVVSGSGGILNSYGGYWLNSFVSGSLIFTRP